ncbi:hypothetical protein [Agromyces larvae]|uniref:Uncharacterized protein n=1 Tax=Agromyces larvae TaxID=2929802 RepID=A0ABY4C2U0_9MICO|nr:hypothetical protein [Agromyces larvae]UOE43090.1 hypothetical protein MTO99_12935 [Agromyces larvae]
MSELDRLLADAEGHCWPGDLDESAWRVLTNWAFQTACLQADEAENRAWEERMGELVRQGLSYEEFTAQRMGALDERVRSRKLTQANLRYSLGFRGARRTALIRREVRSVFDAWVVV